ncbi:hypothetical protein QTL86_01395 [Cellulosilyticum sp. ST5]|uniref:hypothetical protein n=1 Tax=Cellulosilyticum sp. ST5 TaxID=3055805 RepID=UPI0039779E63
MVAIHGAVEIAAAVQDVLLDVLLAVAALSVVVVLSVVAVLLADNHKKLIKSRCCVYG